MFLIATLKRAKAVTYSFLLPLSGLLPRKLWPRPLKQISADPCTATTPGTWIV